MVTDAAEVDTYDVIERDTVPAPAPQSDDSVRERIATLLKWLQPTDFLSPGNEFMKHLHSYVSGTGKWVHESRPFRAWAGLDPALGAGPGDSPAGHHCLHVRGVAGSGKSVLAAHTVCQLQDSGRVVLFFFFRQIVEKNHTAKYLVRDFAAQLLPYCPALVTALAAISQQHAVRGNELDMVWPAVVGALKDEGLAGRVFCVVDALDEMDDGDFEGMVGKLVALATTESASARVMMTSRPLPHIERALDRSGVLRLRLDPTLLSPDVTRYISARMALLDPPLSHDKNELVTDTICGRADGLFLQARLMADNLAEGLRDGRITKDTPPDSLDRLPHTLRAVYEDMLTEHARRSGVTAEQQAKILMCVTHASRPLRLIELGSLLSRMLNVDLRQSKDLVRAGCGRLLELLENETVSVIHHSFTEFLHDLSRKDDEDAFPVLESEMSHAMLATLLLEYLDGCPHLDAAIDDGRTANYDDFDFFCEEETRRSKIRTDTKLGHPLVSYAAKNLFFHISKVPPGMMADQLLAALDRYLVPGKPAFETWMLMGWDGPLSASFNVLHLITAALDGRFIPTYVVEHFAETQSALLDSRDADGLTPLAYAAGHGRSDIAKVILNKGADPTLRGNDGFTPLHRAAEQGNAAVVRLLLNAGVDPLIKKRPVLSVRDRYDECTEEKAGEQRETALTCAFRGDNREVVREFMPFLPPDEVNKCFHRVNAIENLKAILETGKVDVDCFWGGRTKLYQATEARNPGLIKLLLEYGADPNRRSTTGRFSSHNDDIAMELEHPDCVRGPTPLHAFAGIAHQTNIATAEDRERVAQCLQMLLEAGADINATMAGKLYIDQDLTPLHLAVHKTDSRGFCCRSLGQSAKIVTKLLLSAGANSNAKTKSGDTPLHLADTEEPRLLETLVEHGADINAVNAWGRSPLLEMVNQLKCSSFLDKPLQSARAFERLLELGADVHVADEHGDTIFHQIMHCIHSFTDPKFLPFLKKLLSAGANLNKKNKKGQPPLWNYEESSFPSYPCKDDDEEVLRVLIDGGMDLNGRDEEGRTVLWKLGERYGSDLETLEKFIRLGADAGTITNDGMTLLQYLVDQSRPPEWLHYLISIGVRADTLDKNQETTIHTLVRRPETDDDVQEVLQILVDAGAQPLAKNAKGQSALHVAGSSENLGIVLSNAVFRGLGINDPDLDGFTPIHHAVLVGEQAVATLIRAGADPTALSAGGLSPVHVAAQSGETGVVGLLLAQYRKLAALEQLVNMLGNGRAPIHYACRSGNPEAVWTLLRNGADPRITDDKGFTPLHALAEFEPPEESRPFAMTSRADDIVAMLRLAGVDMNAKVVVQMEDKTTSKTLTPLDMAVEMGNWEIVRQLIAHGAEPSDDHKRLDKFVIATDKKRAAEVARKVQASMLRDRSSANSYRGRGRGCRRWRGRWAAIPAARIPLEEEHCFITGGQDILDTKVQSSEADNGVGQNEVDAVEVLRGVLRDGDYDTIKEYVHLGGDVFELDKHRAHTFLHILVQEGRAELLHEFGGKVAEFEAQKRVQQAEEGCGTLLCTACERELPSLCIIQLLVDILGVDVNAVYNPRGFYLKLRGMTAIHVLASGAYFWQIEALEYLLSKGVDIEARSSLGMTPLLAAIKTQYSNGFWREDTVRILLRHGADANAKVTTPGTAPRGGSSALELSSEPGITKLLLENGANVANCPGILTHAIKEWMEPEIVKLLLDTGLNPNELSPGQEKQEEAHRPGTDENSVKGNDETKYKPTTKERPQNLRYALHEAARPATRPYSALDIKSQQQAIIDVLISHGADAYASYPDGSFVLQAILEDRGYVDKLLTGLTEEECNCIGHYGRTLLISACIPLIPVRHPSYAVIPATVVPDVIHTLLSSGADPLAVDDEGRTPLHWFCTFGGQFDEACREAFITLARHNPAAVHIADKQGRKPLHIALAGYASCFQQSPYAIQHLLAIGGDPVNPDPVTGNSALHFIAPRLVGESAAAAAAAALFGDLATRVDINARNSERETPLFSFAAAGWQGTRDPTHKQSHPDYAIAHDITHTNALRVFTDLGADLTAVDRRKRTLLHVTAGREMRGYSLDRGQQDDVENTFKELMGLGVDPRAEDDELMTPIDIAVARNWTNILQLFSEEEKREDEEKKKAREEKVESGSGKNKEIGGFSDKSIS